jgi:very-short-patch-repair endonuclease
MALPAHIVEFLSIHHGVISRHQAIDLGMTRNQIDSATRRRHLIAWQSSVFRAPAAPQTPDQLLAMVCAAHASVVVSHRTAGRLHGFRRLGSDLTITATIPEGLQVSLRGIEMHHASDPMTLDIIERPDGVRYFNPARTLFDLSTVLYEDAVVSVLEQILSTRMGTLDEIKELVARRRQRGRTGSDLMGRLVDGRPADLKPVGSELERRVEKTLIEADLPAPLRQARITLRNGRVVVVDFYWPTHRLVIEVDGTTWHGGYHDRSLDYQRDRQLQALGLTVIRVGEAEEQEGLFTFIRDVRHAIAHSVVDNGDMGLTS